MTSLAITVFILLAATVYVRGWLRLRTTSAKIIPAWRATSFLLGALLTWIAVASPVAYLDGKILTAHMVQHLLLMTFAPPLIWLGAPVLAMWFALPSARGLFLWPALQKLGGILGHPVFCWLAATAALVTWHVPAMFRLGMQSEGFHLLAHASFFATGLLFWWPVVEPWPARSRWPRWSMLLYLFLATLPCDVLSGLLVFSDRIAYPMYLCMPHHSELSALEDQQRAAALMWTCVTVVFLVAGTVLSTQLLSPRVHSPTAEAV